MQKFALTILFLATSAFGLGPEYKFDPTFPIDVIDLSYAGGQGSKRVCVAIFNGPNGPLSSAMDGNDEQACKDPANYKSSGHVFVRLSKFDMTKADETELIDGRPWVYHEAPPISVFRWVEKLSENSHRYEAICQVCLVPDNRKFDVNPPIRVEYCKNEGNEWQIVKDDQGKTRYGEDGKPLLKEVAICPSAKTCLSKEKRLMPMKDLRDLTGKTSSTIDPRAHSQRPNI